VYQRMPVRCHRPRANPQCPPPPPLAVPGSPGEGRDTKVTPQEDPKAKEVPRAPSNNTNPNSNSNTDGPRTVLLAARRGADGAPRRRRGDLWGSSDAGSGEGRGRGGRGVTPSPSLDDVSEERARAGVVGAAGAQELLCAQLWGHQQGPGIQTPPFFFSFFSLALHLLGFVLHLSCSPSLLLGHPSCLGSFKTPGHLV